jgi:hypothetical protein
MTEMNQPNFFYKPCPVNLPAHILVQLSLVIGTVLSIAEESYISKHFTLFLFFFLYSLVPLPPTAQPLTQVIHYRDLAGLRGA